MIEFTRGDLLQADVEALVNAVNCVGVMGRGIALQFKREFPENFRLYRAACERDEVRPGAMFVTETGASSGPRLVVNFPTKRHWRSKSKLEDVLAGLEALRQEVLDREIGSIAIPPLGAGLGGLPWPQVREAIVGALDGLEATRVLLYEPVGSGGAPRSRCV